MRRTSALAHCLVWDAMLISNFGISTYFQASVTIPSLTITSLILLVEYILVLILQ